MAEVLTARRLIDSRSLVAFAYWKLACILEGVFVRHAARTTGNDASYADALAAGVADRAYRALAALRS